MRNKQRIYDTLKLFVIALSLPLVVFCITTSIDLYQDRKLAALSYKDRFTKIYNEGHWGSGSGHGSTHQNASQYIVLLQTYFDNPDYTTYVDLGCGDWQIMEHINIPINKKYIGYDIVENVIAQNSQKYGKTNISFKNIEDLSEVESADLLIVKDVLQHWSSQDVQNFIKNVLPRFKSALITNCMTSANPINSEIVTGQYTAIDLAESPYNLTNLTKIMDYRGGGDKRVYLWINPKKTNSFIAS